MGHCLPIASGRSEVMGPLLLLCGAITPTPLKFPPSSLLNSPTKHFTTPTNPPPVLDSVDTFEGVSSLWRSWPPTYRPPPSGEFGPLAFFRGPNMPCHFRPSFVLICVVRSSVLHNLFDAKTCDPNTRSWPKHAVSPGANFPRVNGYAYGLCRYRKTLPSIAVFGIFIRLLFSYFLLGGRSVGSEYANLTPCRSWPMDQTNHLGPCQLPLGGDVCF